MRSVKEQNEGSSIWRLFSVDPVSITIGYHRHFRLETKSWKSQNKTKLINPMRAIEKKKKTIMLLNIHAYKKQFNST